MEADEAAIAAESLPMQVDGTFDEDNPIIDDHAAALCLPLQVDGAGDSPAEGTGEETAAQEQPAEQPVEEPAAEENAAAAALDGAVAVEAGEAEAEVHQKLAELAAGEAQQLAPEAALLAEGEAAMEADPQAGTDTLPADVAPGDEPEGIKLEAAPDMPVDGGEGDPVQALEPPAESLPEVKDEPQEDMDTTPAPATSVDDAGESKPTTEDLALPTSGTGGLPQLFG